MIVCDGKWTFRFAWTYFNDISFGVRVHVLTEFAPISQKGPDHRSISITCGRGPNFTGGVRRAAAAFTPSVRFFFHLQ